MKKVKCFFFQLDLRKDEWLICEIKQMKKWIVSKINGVLKKKYKILLDLNIGTGIDVFL